MFQMVNELWIWLGATLGAFLFGGICIALGYMAFDIINEQRLKKKQPKDIFSPELKNGKKEEIDERGKENNERRKRAKIRFYERLRNLATKYRGRKQKAERDTGSSTGTGEVAGGEVFQNGIDTDYQGEHRNDESRVQLAEESDLQ